MLETIQHNENGSSFTVIPTEGGVVGNHKIVGLFTCESDARSEDADSLAWGTVDWNSLTKGEQEIARRNSEAL